MNGAALAAVSARLYLSSNDANRNEATITTYVEVVKHLLRRYDTDAVIVKADERISSFKQGPLTPWDLSQTLWDLRPRCGSVYNEQTLRRFFIEGIVISIRSIMRQWWVNND